MNFSASLWKRGDTSSFKPVAAFDMFYQLTYMSAMASAGLSRSKVFQIAAVSTVDAAQYFVAINTLVDEFRYDYAEACRRIGIQAPSENMKSFLLRLSDALRSGEPLNEFLSREAEVMGQDYQNAYERSLENLKQWTNAFTSIAISVALIVIIQMISAMIYSMNVSMMGGLVFTGFAMAGMGAWIINRSAPHETMTMPSDTGSPEQRRTLRLFRLITPLAGSFAATFYMLGVPVGMLLVGLAACLLPIGIAAFRSDSVLSKKDKEFSTFLRSLGGITSSSGTTIKEALNRIDLSSFPHLSADIRRLSTRLQALVEPNICWQRFGTESGSRLINDVVGIFYNAIRMGGDPERVGYLCSLFTARTSGLRSKRRLTAGTFSALATVMQAVVAGLMVFVLSIVNNFAQLVATLMPPPEASGSARPQMSLGMAQFTPEDLQFLAFITLVMILSMALVTAFAIISADGGYRLKTNLYLSLTIFISGLSYLFVPSMVAGILKA